MKIARTVVVAGGIAAAASVAYAVHPAALFPPATPPHGAPAEPGLVSPGRASPVRVRAPVPRVLVYVAGEVAHPGVYGVAADARAADALARAGGPKPDADLVAVNLAAHVGDGDEIAVPKRGEAARPHPRTNRARVPRSRSAGHRRSSPRAFAAPATGGAIDVNTADEGTLSGLPGLGPALAARIVAFRAANGPFDSVDELADVSGITPGRLDRILPYVTAGAPERK